tara:strand:- start:80 stop:334 length:255 start_codon:yes stop_codon:yes gene_type:complete
MKQVEHETTENTLLPEHLLKEWIEALSDLSEDTDLVLSQLSLLKRIKEVRNAEDKIIELLKKQLANMDKTIELKEKQLANLTKK